MGPPRPGGPIGQADPHVRIGRRQARAGLPVGDHESAESSHSAAGSCHLVNKPTRTRRKIRRDLRTAPRSFRPRHYAAAVRDNVRSFPSAPGTAGWHETNVFPILAIRSAAGDAVGGEELAHLVQEAVERPLVGSQDVIVTVDLDQPAAGDEGVQLLSLLNRQTRSSFRCGISAGTDSRIASAEASTFMLDAWVHDLETVVDTTGLERFARPDSPGRGPSPVLVRSADHGRHHWYRRHVPSRMACSLRARWAFLSALPCLLAALLLIPHRAPSTATEPNPARDVMNANTVKT